jgi:hypothetical protein
LNSSNIWTNEVELSKISTELNIPFSTNQLEDADLYIISVSDSAVENVSDLIKNENALVAHTSGSLPIEILKGNYRKASFYPLQTFSKTKNLDYSKIPFFIEAENQIDEKSLFELASIISENVETSIMKRENTSTDRRFCLQLCEPSVCKSEGNFGFSGFTFRIFHSFD